MLNIQVWDWRSRRVSLNVNSKRGGQWEESFGSAKKSARDQPLFSDPVNRAQFCYMDNLLLSVSSNKLFIFNVNLPERGEAGPSQYRLAKMVTMSECKTITTMSAINQFYSFLALVACSDRSVRVYDMNQAKVSRGGLVIYSLFKLDFDLKTPALNDSSAGCSSVCPMSLPLNSHHRSERGENRTISNSIEYVVLPYHLPCHTFPTLK